MQARAEGSLAHGPLGKQILRFSLPLMISNVLQVLFNMSDVAVVGRFSGARALGAVGSTTILVSLFTGFLIGMGSGVNALVARYLGADSREETEHTVHTAAILCLLVGAVLLGLGLIFARPMLTLLHTKAELIDGAALYLHIYFLGMPAMALYNFGNGVLSAAGDTRRPLVYLLIAGILNVCLNLFFVIVCRMSEDGVALASILSQYLSAALILIALFRSREDYALRLRKLRLHAEKAKMLLNLGLSAGFQNAIFAVANLFIQSAVNSFPTVVVEGNSAASNADSLVYDVMAAFHTACASFIGQNFGAGHRDRIKKSYFISVSYSCAFGTVLGLLLVFFGSGFLAPRRRAGGYDPPEGHGLFLRRFGLHGLHDRSVTRTWQMRRADHYCDCRFLRVPRAVGLYGLCIFRNASVALSDVCFLVDDHGDRGDHLFPPHLSQADGLGTRGNLIPSKKLVCPIFREKEGAKHGC